MKLTDLHEAKSNKFAYHVTFTKHVPNIMKQGLKPLQTSNWKKADKEGRYNEDGGVFAFADPNDAFKWAFKQNWDFKKPVSIIKMKKTDTWDIDPSEDIELQMGEGDALRSMKAVPASEMIEAFDFEDFKTPAELDLTQAEWLEGIIDKLS